MSIEESFLQWKKIKSELGRLFQIRDEENAKALMETATSSFTAVLYLLNGQQRASEMDHLQIKPVNVTERLTFITDHPSHYHAYIQLSELFTELEKSYMKETMVKRIK